MALCGVPMAGSRIRASVRVRRCVCDAFFTVATGASFFVMALAPAFMALAERSARTG